MNGVSSNRELIGDASAHIFSDSAGVVILVRSDNTEEKQMEESHPVSLLEKTLD